MKTIHKRVFIVLISILLFFVIMLLRIGYIVISKSDLYIERAYDLWTRNIPVSYKRGKIYDCNGKLIVGNTISPSLAIIPKQIIDKEYTINYLSTVLEVNKNDIKKHFEKNVSIELIKPFGKNISLEKAKIIIAKNLPGVYVVGDVVRYYPYGNVLSHLLGIVGSDNQGLSGLELKYDSLLKGEIGSVNIFTDAHGKKIDNISDSYTDSNGGIDLYLTINIDIQVALENVLNNAEKYYDCEEAIGLMMNPKNSSIIAIASRPNFDIVNYQDFNQEIYNRNLPIWKSYEYGSTFKFVTYTAGLEEGVFNVNDHFNCAGFTVVDGTRIKDWKAGGHGTQTFYEVMQNSCNPGFMEIGRRLGKEKLFDYIEKYGFGKKTNVDIIGESSGIVFDLNNVGPVELATSSFGQGNSGTAIQLVNACSAAVNGGILNIPYVVKGLGVNSTIIFESEKQEVRRVISEETSQIVCNALERVVSLGTARGAYIEGYRVGAKTGTAQIASEGGYLDNQYILSLLGVMPVNDPEIICYIAITKPKTYIQYGGVVAAPLVKEVLMQAITIADLPKQEGGIPIDSRWYIDDFYYTVSDYVGLKVKEVNQHGYYQIKIIGDGDTIISQSPSANQRVVQGSYVYLYTN
ncbi:MAG: stage V sporulation protein D [Bacilli bacterium]|nr:stage V sporulation protein D [Bacilli bacterium]